tara:strand:+ start:75 stop:449 length:375 start_codon:yes stop_codon:yes gene_type:complete
VTITRHKVPIATTGSAGSASGSGLLAIPPSELLALYFDFNASAPGTLDTTITAIGGDEADRTILTLTNVNTDAWYRPKEQDHDSAGAAITGAYKHPVIHNNLLIELAQADALSPCVTVIALVKT